MSKLLRISALIFFVSFACYSQDAPPSDEDAVPVDGGVGFLMAAGAIWGIKKLKEKK
jgi:hypothetical protein